MKTKLISLLALLYISTSLSAQTAILDVFNSMPYTDVPYNTLANYTKPKQDGAIEPNVNRVVPYELWNGALNIDMWRDINLVERKKNASPEVIIYRSFLRRGDHLVGVLKIWDTDSDNVKKVMVTINRQSGQLIDQLQVGYFSTDPNMYQVHVQEFGVKVQNSRLIVEVCRMRPSTRFTNPLPPTVNAWLHRETYEIDPYTGKFARIQEKTYYPKEYPRSIFSNSAPAFGTYGEDPN